MSLHVRPQLLQRCEASHVDTTTIAITTTTTSTIAITSTATREQRYQQHPQLLSRIKQTPVLAICGQCQTVKRSDGLPTLRFPCVALPRTGGQALLFRRCHTSLDAATGGVVCHARDGQG